MLPLMNYSTNNIPQYQQPIYQNPYMDNRMANLQALQQSLQPMQSQGLLTRVVDNFDTITANDVPMQGGGLFVKSDGEQIQFRQWTSQGTIQTTSYLAQKSNLDSEVGKISSDEEKLKFSAFNEVLEGIQTKVDSLSDKIDEILKQKTTSKSRKEVVADE